MDICKNLIEGLKILSKYDCDITTADPCIILVCVTKDGMFHEVNSKDTINLEGLGWRYDTISIDEWCFSTETY